MSTIKDGGSILPAMKSNCGGYGIAPHEHGLTIRDWFAGMALQGFVSSYKNGETCEFEFIAGDSYSLADAMLAAREGKGEK